MAQWGTEGSRRLHRHNCEERARQTRGQRLPPEQIERRRQTALAVGLWPLPSPEKPWTEAELTLLGTVPDAELAARIGRTENAVRIMRNRRGIPKAVARSLEEDGATVA